VFRGELEIDRSRSEELAEAVLGTGVTEAGLLPLDLAIWPEPGIAAAAALPGLDIVSSRELAQYRPVELTEQVSRMADGRDAYGVFMHSMEDWAAFAVWSDGKPVRVLSLSPDRGIIEDQGERLPFEEPFWAGEHPVSHIPDYPLPFHPLDLGNEALRSFFGFILEGRPGDTFAPDEFEIPAFRTTGPDRTEPQHPPPRPARNPPGQVSA
jgi:hypothetical protein